MSSQTTSAKPESLNAAKAAGLRWVTDESPGIRRENKGKVFSYRLPSGKRVTDANTLIRIKSLVIPPAWKDVWICPHANGHIQAVGRDDRGRKQYRYHSRWREVRDETKYGRMTAFAKSLPKLRRTVRRHLALKGLPREKVLAAVVRVMEMTLIRVGNDEYAKANESFGLTTLRDRHAKINGSKVVFDFKGKSGVKHEIDFEDKRLAQIVAKCQELPGYELFQYRTRDGKVRDVDSADVNAYIRGVTGQDFTAKDFRTWAGTVLAAKALEEVKAFDSKAAAKRNVRKAIESVARKLGNTAAVCRKCYIHPAVLNSYMDGSLAKNLSRKASRTLSESAGKLSIEEAAILGLLESRLTNDSGRKSRQNDVTPARTSDVLRGLRRMKRGGTQNRRGRGQRSGHL